MTMDEFFPKKRRRVDLIRPTMKRNAQKEKRISLQFSMPMTSDNLVGMPDYIGQGFEAIGKENSSMLKAEIGTELDAMNIRFFQLSEKDERPEKQVDLRLIGALLSAFNLSKNPGRGDVPQKDVMLTFKVTVPFKSYIWQWAGDRAGDTLFAEFESTQQTFEAAAKRDSEDDEQMDFAESAAGVAEAAVEPEYPEGTDLSAPAAPDSSGNKPKRSSIKPRVRKKAVKVKKANG